MAVRVSRMLPGAHPMAGNLSTGHPPRSSAVDARQRLGHAHRLLDALGLKRQLGGELRPARGCPRTPTSLARMRTLLPTGSGAGKRTRLRP